MRHRGYEIPFEFSGRSVFFRCFLTDGVARIPRAGISRTAATINLLEAIMGLCLICLCFIFTVGLRFVRLHIMSPSEGNELLLLNSSFFFCFYFSATDGPGTSLTLSGSRVFSDMVEQFGLLDHNLPF